MNAIILTRVSSQEQARGWSLDTQRDQCREYAAALLDLGRACEEARRAMNAYCQLPDTANMERVARAMGRVKSAQEAQQVARQFARKEAA